MSFLLFDIRNDPLPLTDNAVKEVVTRIDRDYPSYVKQLPCIFDVQSKKLYNGHKECTEYLAQFEPKIEPNEPPKPEPVPVKIEEPVPVEEPKKKVVRRRAPKPVVVAAEPPTQEEPKQPEDPKQPEEPKQPEDPKQTEEKKVLE